MKIIIYLGLSFLALQTFAMPPDELERIVGDLTQFRPSKTDKKLFLNAGLAFRGAHALLSEHKKGAIQSNTRTLEFVIFNLNQYISLLKSQKIAQKVRFNPHVVRVYFGNEGGSVEVDKTLYIKWLIHQITTIRNELQEILEIKFKEQEQKMEAENKKIGVLRTIGEVLRAIALSSEVTHHPLCPSK